MNNFFKNIYYINLDKRTDRKKHFEKEMKKLDIKKYNRFSAVYNKVGAIGCSKSHLKILKKANELKLEYVIIMEDDIEFINPTLFKKLFNTFLNENIKYDILLLAGNLKKACYTNNKNILKVSECWTTTGYIVKRHYYDTLIKNIEEGVNKLEKNYKYSDKLDLESLEAYSIDIYWNKLQKKDNWFILYPRTVSQLSNISDINGKDSNYHKYLLDKY